MAHVTLLGPLSSCSCGEYHHTGIPCVHLAAVCFSENRRLIDIVHPSEHLVNYKNAYQEPFDLPSEEDIARHLHLRDPRLRFPPSRPNPSGRPRTRRVERAGGTSRGHRSGTIGHGDTAVVATAASSAAASPAGSGLQHHQRLRQRQSYRCSVCGETGHNSRRCPSQNDNDNGNDNFNLN